MYINTPFEISYDIVQYPFKEIISEILEVPRLEDIHLIKKYDILSRDKDQSTIWHKKYYDKFEKYFLPTYLNFIKDIKYRFGYEEIIYQSIPTFRVQLAGGNVGVGEWHKDKTYNHGNSEVNFWLPFVNTNPLNTLWMESKEDRGDYRPYTVEYGKILVFNGANLYHGNKHNESNETRVSIDFRLVDPAKFISSEEESINTKTKFKIGSYFNKL